MEEIVGDKVPSISDETIKRWQDENQYPCGTLKKCEKCDSLRYSKCITWTDWFKKTWSVICANVERG